MAIKPEDMLKLSAQIKKAEEDTTPYAVVADKEIHVVGDANKTENKKRDYAIRFRFPKDYEKMFPDAEKSYIGNYFTITTEYKDVTITPRSDMKILASISRILPYVKKLNDDGTVDDPTDDELIQMCIDMPDEIEDAMYLLTSHVLGVPTTIMDFMLATDVFGFVSSFVDDFPEVFNEADGFFG